VKPTITAKNIPQGKLYIQFSEDHSDVFIYFINKQKLTTVLVKKNNVLKIRDLSGNNVYQKNYPLEFRVGTKDAAEREIGEIVDGYISVLKNVVETMLESLFKIKTEHLVFPLENKHAVEHFVQSVAH
jgi:isocitrate dehydrogenase